MKKIFDLTKDGWDSEFIYAFSPVTKERKKFPQAEDGRITVGFNENINDYDYISVVTKEKYTKGCRATLKCSFDKKGAPLIVFTDDITEDSVYALHFEAVAYEGGYNVWHILPFPERTERPIKPAKILFEQFSIPNNKEIELSVTFGDKSIEVELEGVKSSVSCEDFPESFHVGFTACEGICNFSEFSLEY